MKTIPLDQLTFEQFHALLHTKFGVGSEASSPVEMELIEATPYPRAKPPMASTTPGEICQFSLVFAGPATPLLPQKIYRFAHDQLGVFELFIVPIRQDQGRLYYEAVFNRLPRA